MKKPARWCGTAVVVMAGLLGSAMGEEPAPAPPGGQVRIGIGIGGGGRVDAAPAGPMSAWAGNWRLVTFGEGEGAQAVAEGLEVTFVLAADGTVSGRAACNRYGGQAEAVADVEGGLRFGPLFGTRMACPEPAMSTERQFLDTMGQVASAAREDDTLRLRDAEGAVLLVFRAR